MGVPSQWDYQPTSQAAKQHNIRIVPVTFSVLISSCMSLQSSVFHGQLWAITEGKPKSIIQKKPARPGSHVPKTEKRNTKNRTKNKNSQLANIPSLTGWLLGSSYTQIFGYTCLWAPTSSLLVGAKVHLVSDYNCLTVSFLREIILVII